MSHIALDESQVGRLKELAAGIAARLQQDICRRSSVSVERAVLRLYGVDGVDEEGTPLPNRLVELLRHREQLADGASAPFAAAMLESGRDPETTARLILQGHVDFGRPAGQSPDAIRRRELELAEQAVTMLDATRKTKNDKVARLSLGPQPWKYVIVATGNIYEDRLQAKSVARNGADIIAVIRSTAQSLLDYIPHGATTEGVGGTFATRENFKIMRAALDEEGKQLGRYLRLVNYASGLCMAEIAVCAAQEDLDMLLNDSMYGILFRDINMLRTFVDQHFSRLICARSGIIINTGEDNYLTTADAVESAYTVTASQLINEALGRCSNLPEELMGLGHAFEIDPSVENSFLLELAHAQLARQLFPRAPLKYMPPTKHKSTDIFFSQVMDTMFNLASIATGQGIHLAGMLTESIHTPLMQDRYQSISAINYVFNTSRQLSGELEFKKDGLIARRAQVVMDQVEAFLGEVADLGLMEIIAQGRFGGIKRLADGGKGLDGVFVKGDAYSNPVLERLEREGQV